MCGFSGSCFPPICFYYLFIFLQFWPDSRPKISCLLPLIWLFFFAVINFDLIIDSWTLNIACHYMPNITYQTPYWIHSIWLPVRCLFVHSFVCYKWPESFGSILLVPNFALKPIFSPLQYLLVNRQKYWKKIYWKYFFEYYEIIYIIWILISLNEIYYYYYFSIIASKKRGIKIDHWAQ